MTESEIIALHIARHLEEFPDHADTADGIRRWWLASYRGNPGLGVVKAALLKLEADGVVVRRVLPGGAVLWRAAPSLGEG